MYHCDWQQLATLLIRHHGLHEGWWMITAHFSMHGFSSMLESNASTTCPAALFRLESLGLLACESTHPLAVDAAVVNPPDAGEWDHALRELKGEP